jgi:hypothetical protein
VPFLKRRNRRFAAPGDSCGCQMPMNEHQAAAMASISNGSFSDRDTAPRGFLGAYS